VGHNGFVLPLNLHNQGYVQGNPTSFNELECIAHGIHPIVRCPGPGTNKVREESGVVWHCALLVVGPLQLWGWQVWWTCQGSCKSLYTILFLVWYNTKQLVISSHCEIVFFYVRRGDLVKFKLSFCVTRLNLRILKVCGPE
jgi:hypothetical protein